MKTVTICEDLISPSSWQTSEVEDLCAFLAFKWQVFPATGRVYLDYVSDANDVTPHSIAEIAKLQAMQGHFYIVIYPEGPLAILAIVAIVISCVAVGLVFLLKPNTPPLPEASPNNELTDRQNRARPNERIPDIFGTVRSTPDLIAVPYRIFFQNTEFEVNYMCASRGSLTIVDCMDDTTPVDWIDGEFVAVYAPFTSPNGATSAESTPQVTFGTNPFTSGLASALTPGTCVMPSFGLPVYESSMGGGAPSVTISVTGDGTGASASINWTATYPYDDVALYTPTISFNGGIGYTTATVVVTIGTAGYWLGIGTYDYPVTSFTTSPTYSDLPGTSYIPNVCAVQQSGSVNGQVLRAPNFGLLATDNNVSFQYPDVMQTNGTENLDFTDYFVASTITQPQYLDIYPNDSGINASDPAEIVHSVAITGRYLILSVSPTTVVLAAPGGGACDTVCAAWDTIATFEGEASTFYHSFNVVGEGNGQVGPIVLQITDLNQVWCNFVSKGGLYYVDDNGNQHPYTFSVQISVQRVDINNNPIGDILTGTVNLVGSGVDRIDVGSTLQFAMPTQGPVQVWAQLLTPKPTDHRDSYCDQIQWRDLYGVSPVSQTNFGNVTTAIAITTPTPAALSVKERKINMLVTRNVPTWNNRTGFALSTGQTVPTFSSPIPSNNVADILCAMALDPYIGRRSVAELNVPDIYTQADSAYMGAGREDGTIAAYFETFLATEFCYTFDDSKVSFEEAVAQLAQAVNCIAYRRGSTMSLYFEAKTENSCLLFNHRNKLPDSETRTVTFGTLNDNDGIEYDYIDPNAPNFPNIDTTVTLYFPVDQSAQNPKKIKSIGVRNYGQAMLNGWRLYQKLIYQNSQTEFEATQEAALLILNNRILVADNTRNDTQDGQIVGQTALLVTTSQPLTFVEGQTYTAFIQHYNETVEAIAVTAGPEPNQMLLATAPALPLVYDQTMFALTTYLLVGSAAVRSDAFLLSDKEWQQNGTYKLTAVNYDDNYYGHDTDVVNGLILLPAQGYAPQGYTGSGIVGPGTLASGVTLMPDTFSTRTSFTSLGFTESGTYLALHIISPPVITPVTTAPTEEPTPAAPARTVTATGLVAPTDSILRVDATAGAVTLTLPISPNDGQLVIVKKIDSSGNTVTILDNGNPIDGASSQVITAAYGVLRLQFDLASSTWGLY